MWQFLMSCALASAYMCVHTLHEPNGDALLWFFAAPTLFLFAVTAKVTKEDNEERARNPEYVRTIDLLIPILIFRFWKPAVFIILAVILWITKSH